MKVGDLVKYTPNNKGALEGIALIVRSEPAGMIVKWLDDGTEDYTCDFLPGELEVISESR